MTWEHLGECAALGTAVLWTLSTLVWTSVGRNIGALSVCFLRLPICCLFLLGYGQLVRGHCLPTDASRETWLLLGASGLFGFFLADLCAFKAFLLIGPRLALLILSLTPPSAALIEWLFFGDHFGLRHCLAMGVTLLGVSWVVLEQPETPVGRPDRRRVAWGVTLSLVAVVGQAAGYVLSKHGMGDYDAFGATFIRILGAMAGHVVLLTLLRRWTVVVSATRHARSMALLTAGAFVGPFLGVALCMVALRHCHAGVTATIISLMPVLILPLVIFVYREKISLRAVGGALVSVAGVGMLVL
jgi:drug/metabolite transporter (DMT)-like permease